MKVHANARLTPAGRALLVRRVEIEDRPVTVVRRGRRDQRANRTTAEPDRRPSTRTPHAGDPATNTPP